MPYRYSTAEQRERWLDICAAKYEACFTDKATLVKALGIRQTIACTTVLTEDNVDAALQAIDTHDTITFTIADSERHGNVLANRFDIDFVQKLDLPPSYVLSLEAALFYSIDTDNEADDLNFRQHYFTMMEAHPEELEAICAEQDTFIAAIDDLITQKIAQNIYEKRKDKVQQSHEKTMGTLRQEISYAIAKSEEGLPPVLKKSVHTILLEISKQKKAQQLPIFSRGLTKKLQHLNEAIQTDLEEAMRNIDALVSELQQLMENTSLSPLIQERLIAILELKPVSLLEAQSHLSYLGQCKIKVERLNKSNEYKQRYLNTQNKIRYALQNDLWSVWTNRHLVFEFAQTYQERDLDILGWEKMEEGIVSMERALQQAVKNTDTSAKTPPKAISNKTEGSVPTYAYFEPKLG
ncbi:MAG: hypothetical protein NXI01_04650 [Gammaproteobacteria bacterium]|nr:hypothetical protein [Gammaproteobacteria bacterium]